MSTGRHTLIKGGTVVSMDPDVGDLARGDVLIDRGVIVAVATSIEAEADVIDATDMIVLPGFCDPHIHAWQGALGRLIPNHATSALENAGRSDPDGSPTRSYVRTIRDTFGPLYDPEDIYIGTLATLLTALDGGITTVCDNMHNARSPDHSDASIAALRDAGVRGIHAYGRSRAGTAPHEFPHDAYRLRERYFGSDDQLTTMRLFVIGRDPVDEVADILRVRRDLDLWLSIDSGVHHQPLTDLYGNGGFDGRETINHGTDLTLEERRLIVDGGSRVNVCPRTETQFRRGRIPYDDWIDVGLRPGISNDNPTTYAIDMFHEMQTLYSHVRAEHFRDGRTPAGLSVRTVLEAATQRGADCCGLGGRVGSLSPGKQADIVLVRADDLRLAPLNNVVGSIVEGADVGLVDTVLVAGRVVKRAGRLAGVDVAGIRARLRRSQERLLTAAAWPLSRVDFTD